MYYTKQEMEEGKRWAFLGILLTAIGFLLVIFFKKKNQYALYYAKQGLVLFLAAIIISILERFLDLIPVLGKLAATILWVLLIIFWILGMIYSLSGKEKDVPLIGELARKISV